MTLLLLDHVERHGGRRDEAGETTCDEQDDAHHVARRSLRSWRSVRIHLVSLPSNDEPHDDHDEGERGADREEETRSIHALAAAVLHGAIARAALPRQELLVEDAVQLGRDARLEERAAFFDFGGEISREIARRDDAFFVVQRDVVEDRPRQPLRRLRIFDQGHESGVLLIGQHASTLTFPFIWIVTFMFVSLPPSARFAD